MVTKSLILGLLEDTSSKAFYGFIEPNSKQFINCMDTIVNAQEKLKNLLSVDIQVTDLVCVPTLDDKSLEIYLKEYSLTEFLELKV